MVTDKPGAALLGLLLAPLGLAALDQASLKNRLTKQARLMAALEDISLSKADPSIKRAIGIHLLAKYDKRLAAVTKQRQGKLMEILTEIKLLGFAGRRRNSVKIIKYYNQRLRRFYRVVFSTFTAVFLLITMFGSMLYPGYEEISIPTYFITFVCYLAFEIKIKAGRFPSSADEACELLRLPDDS